MSFITVGEHHGFSPEKLQKHNLFESPDMFCDVYCLEPGQSQRPHRHDDATKFYYVLDGSGEFLVNTERRTLSAGQLAFARPGEVHGVENTSGKRLRLLVVMAPNPNK